MNEKLNPAAIMQARTEHHKASMLKPFVGRKQNHSLVVDDGAPCSRTNMTKQEQFLFIVQTAILANGINLSSGAKPGYLQVFSATDVLGTLDDAIYASERIPYTVSAYEAAHEFCNFIFANRREADEPDGDKPQVPPWFAR